MGEERLVVGSASKFEIVAARAWNVLNEGKSFHPVFVLGTFVLLHMGGVFSAAFWGRAWPAIPLTFPRRWTASPPNS